MTFVDIIGLWPTVAELAEDVGAPYERVKMWKLRNSIRAVHFPSIIDAAQCRGFTKVTYEALIQAAATRDISKRAA